MRTVTATINFQVTQTQDGTVNMDKMTVAQKNSYLEAHMAVQQHMTQASMQYKQQQQNDGPRNDMQDSNSTNQQSSLQQQGNNQRQSNNNNNPQQNQALPTTTVTPNEPHNYVNAIKVPQVSSSSSGGAESTFTVPDDVGMGFEGGVRVLQSLGSWSPEIPYNIPRPNLIPFTEPYVEGGSMHPASRLKALQQVQQASCGIRKTNTSKTTHKAFECSVCGKGLARKDKLTIHMRIHTGEKPYICEVCNKAFARRDKLVIHMNKFKHVTPTNIAPLGKRFNNLVKKKEPDDDNKNSLDQIQHHSAQHNIAVGNPSNQHPQSSTAIPGIIIPHHHEPPQLSWTCELCGRMFSTRDEWSLHAKSHLEY
ncbi:early growth response protein 1 isoform X3 [Condylostylus longicornis]|nr:early growth response protein 1 isoform X3 [Condylostylus longicornis]